MKKCYRCRRLLPYEEFWRSKRERDGFDSSCKECSRAKRTVVTMMLAQAKRRAKLKEREFLLTLEDIKTLNERQAGLCALTGYLLDWEPGPLTPFRASLDRIDSAKGYTTDNIQLVVVVANRFKGQMAQLDFIELCRRVVHHIDALPASTISGC